MLGALYHMGMVYGISRAEPHGCWYPVGSALSIRHDELLCYSFLLVNTNVNATNTQCPYSTLFPYKVSVVLVFSPAN